MGKIFRPSSGKGFASVCFRFPSRFPSFIDQICPAGNGFPGSDGRQVVWIGEKGTQFPGCDGLTIDPSDALRWNGPLQQQGNIVCDEQLQRQAI
jgi:hypothetical protein